MLNILVTIAQNLVAPAMMRPGTVHSCSNLTAMPKSPSLFFPLRPYNKNFLLVYFFLKLVTRSVQLNLHYAKGATNVYTKSLLYLCLFF